MKCPLLHETQVRQCRAAGFRKAIPCTGLPAEERCSTAAYHSCPTYLAHPEADAERPHCPYVEESLTQYCSATAIPKFLPYSESSACKCVNGSFRYCDVFVEIAKTPDVAPKGACFTANHLWIDIAPSGVFHIGIDHLAAQLLREVSAVSCVLQAGAVEPMALLRVKDVEWPLIFPEPVRVTARNLYLRANPAKLVTHPYTLGWIFEGEGAAAVRGRSSLIAAEDASHWMQSETRRLADFMYREFGNEKAGLLNDGGEMAPEAVSRLEKEQIIMLFNEFLSPNARPPRSTWAR